MSERERPGTACSVRPRFGLEMVQAMLVVVAIATSVFAIVEPIVDQVDDTLARRRAAMIEFEVIASQVEGLRAVDPELREAELRDLGERARALQAAWVASGVSLRLRPEIETGPIGPVLRLVDTGPRSKGAMR